MFEQFSNAARNIITLASSQRSSYGDGLIRSEHLLLAILEYGKSVHINTIFEHFQIDVETLTNDTMEFLESSTTSETQQSIAFDASAKNVISQALRETIQLSTVHIQPEHLLLSLLAKGSDSTITLLNNAGLEHKTVRAFIISAFTNPENSLPNVDTDLVDDNKDVSGARVSRPSVGRPDSALNTFGHNLTQDAMDGLLDPVIGRNKETARLMQVLARRTKNNPVLVGDPGVGKTAIVEGLAQALLSPSAPKQLKGRQVYTIDLPAMVAGARYRGDFEERLKKVMAEVRERGNIIIFIDEIHTMIGAGSVEGGMDAANILKPMLARGELHAIGATTDDEYRKHFEKDAALARRFQRVLVAEPTVDETVKILEGLRDAYELHHGVTVTDSAMRVAASLSDRYITDRQLPDKAIDLIDEACSRAKLNDFVPPPRVIELNTELASVIALKKEAVNKEAFDKASKLRAQETALMKERDALIEEWETSEESNVPVVDEFTIAELLSESTGIPVFKINEDESTRLLRMEKELHKRVIGQNDAVKSLSRTIRRQRTGLKDPNRPIGSFIFAGPTGVGKSELAKGLAEFLFSDDKALITIDMSEYSEKHTVSRLFGPPPGYVGYEDGGQLTEAVRRRPFSVVLLDEIEKAHPSVFDPLLQVLDEGRLTDGQGRVIDFKNTVIIMTTNLGSRALAERQVGFDFGGTNEVADYARMSAKVNEALKDELRPEFLNRVDETLVFPHLNTENLNEIVNIFVNQLGERLTVEGYALDVSDVAKAELCVLGYDKALGARPLRRVIQREIETPISELMLLGGRTKKIKVDYKNGAFTFNNSTYAKIQMKIDALSEVDA